MLFISPHTLHLLRDISIPQKTSTITAKRDIELQRGVVGRGGAKQKEQQ